MDLTALLAILLAAVIANTIVMVVMLQRARRSRARELAAQASGAGRISSGGTRSAGVLGASSVPIGMGSFVGVGAATRSGPAAGPAAAGADAPGFLDASAFHELLTREDGRLQRYHRPATVVVFDLDGLSALTERLGADAGARVVAAMADTIRRLARDADHVATLGTGRFGVLLPETDEVAAINYVERVRRASELWLESGAISVRLVIGWSGTTGDPSLLDAYQVALDRMYAEARRNARTAAASISGPTVSVLGGPDVESAIAS